MKSYYKSYKLDFKFPAGTSRGVLLHKPSSFLILEDGGLTGIGECSVIPGLSIDDENNYEQTLIRLCNILNQITDFNDKQISSLVHQIILEIPEINAFPSILFGLEIALLDLKNGGVRQIFTSEFSLGNASIPINGLVWMGDVDFMNKQIQDKIEQGYHCIKLKVGALDFQSELNILRNIRTKYTADELELRLDANGAFSVDEAYGKLKLLSQFDIHSIEQPIKAGNWKAMADLCRVSPIPIALDEELIGMDMNFAEDMLTQISPDYIILKPSLIGGFERSEKWISLAQRLGISWWVTSALESNIGLNAIAQWTATLYNKMPQGLGTGQLYHNNIPSPLVIENASLYYNIKNHQWDLSPIFEKPDQLLEL